MRLWFALLAACGTSSTTPEQPVTPPAPVEGQAVSLADLSAEGTFELPALSRSQVINDSFSPRGPVRRRKSIKPEFKSWAFPLFADSALFPAKQAGARSFGNFEPPDLTITYKGSALRFERGAKTGGTYGYSREELWITLPAEAGQPDPKDVVITWPEATEAARAQQFSLSGQSAEEFAVRTLIEGVTSRRGVLLPAPASATWNLTVPPKGTLTYSASLLQPMLREVPTSDGATVTATLRVGQGEPVVLSKERLRVGDEEAVRIDLSDYAGQQVELSITTTGGDSAEDDLVFLEQPTLYPSKENPRRVVLLYLDTLRRDHLGVYGYERPTTPGIDAWAKGAMQFTNTRSVAPWTLPSARSALSGSQPEDWSTSDTLPSRMMKAGYYSYGIVGNAFLSHTFEMHRGFGRYDYDHLLPANKIVDRGLEVLEDHPDQDVFLYLQFMDAHLPYMETKAYRGMFAGPQPSGLSKVTRNELIKLKESNPQFNEIREYVIARYDQNIRMMDDQLARLFEALPKDATVVVFSDHGEEFWDHGGYEHGHDFYDEVLAVPLLISSPHTPVGQLDAPTSLLDVTPTVLELEGLEYDVDKGISLVGATFGDEEVIKALTDRPQGYGRPLYGPDGWGVYADGMKWLAREQKLTLTAVDKDPTENTLVDGADDAKWPEDLSEALGADVPKVWAFTARQLRAAEGYTLKLTHPKGLKRGWLAYDPRSYYEQTEFIVGDDGSLTITIPPNGVFPPTLYVEPNGPTSELSGLSLTLSGGSEGTKVLTDADVAVKGRSFIGQMGGRLLLRAFIRQVPEPFGKAVEAYNPDLEDALKELGYVE